jgi:hypothetical protein
MRSLSMTTKLKASQSEYDLSSCARKESDGSFLVALPNPFGVVSIVARHVEEGQRAPPAAP